MFLDVIKCKYIKTIPYLLYIENSFQFFIYYNALQMYSQFVVLVTSSCNPLATIL